MATYWEDIGEIFKIIALLVLSRRLPIEGSEKIFKIFSRILQIFHLLDGYQLRDACGSEDENNLWILLGRGVFLPFSSATT